MNRDLMYHPKAKSTIFSDYGIIPCGDNVLSLHEPVVMGIINLTPDSFYKGSRFSTQNEIIQVAGTMIEDGASVIDLGAISTRPGAGQIDETEEMKRLIPNLKALKREFPDSVFSVDTYRSNIVKAAFDEGAGMINDISAGSFDEKLLKTVASTGLPYILMHMQGTPGTMQKNPQYTDVVNEVTAFLTSKISILKEMGVKHMIADPGFGFGKTIQHNFELLNRLHELSVTGVPILVGLSRKSMIYKLLNITPEESLPATTALNTLALLNGASILRVHDVKEAVHAVKLVKAYLGQAE